MYVPMFEIGNTLILASSRIGASAVNQKVLINVLTHAAPTRKYSPGEDRRAVLSSSASANYALLLDFKTFMNSPTSYMLLSVTFLFLLYVRPLQGPGVQQRL